MANAREGARQLKGMMDEKASNTRWMGYGIVEEVRLEDAYVILSIMPDDIKTNWLRISHVLSGNEYFVGGLPEVGTEVICLFNEADPNEVVVLAANPQNEEDVLPETFEDEKDFFIIPRHGGKIMFRSDGIEIQVEDGKFVYLGQKTGSKQVLTTDFLDKYNADMALVAAHTNTIAPDPTLSSVGNATQKATKVKAY